MKKFFNYIFSMQFAGTLLLIFAAAVGTATFIENDHGTTAAKVLVYNSLWFEVLLLITGISLIGSVFKYKLYERKRYVVLFFHLAFILILLGAAITRFFGYEGTMLIREGESSNEIISGNPYVQFTVDKGQQEYKFNEERLFSEFKKNRFNQTFHFDGEECTLKFDEYVPNAAEAVVDDPNGIPIISFVTVDKGSRKNSYIRSGECKTESGLTLCFDHVAPQPGAILINYSEANGLQFTAPFATSVMNMMAQTTDTLARDSIHTLETMKLYSMNGIQLVVRSFSAKGKTKVVTSPHETNGAGGIIMNLTYKGKTEQLSAIGGKDMIGQPVSTVIDGVKFDLAYGSKIINIPFSVKLRDFQLERYPGSMSPSSFASEVTVLDPAKGVEKPYRIFMNNILNYGGYRFFQSSYDKDELGTILSVNNDKWGTIMTYIGYSILAAGLVFNFFSKNSRFRMLAKASAELRRQSSVKTMMVILMAGALTLTSFSQVNFDPKAISETHAKKFGELLVQDKDGRMKPVSTLSSEILRKVSRKDKFMGLSSEQVFLGILTNPTYWESIPLIKVSNSQLKELIGVSGNYAAFNDFVDLEEGQYKLGQYINEAMNKKPAERDGFDKDVIKVDERVNVFYMAYTGDFLNIFPEPGHPNFKWHNSSEADMFDTTNAGFVRNILPVYYSAVLEAMHNGDWSKADENLGFIKIFQDKFGKEIMPPASKVKLEIFNNDFNIFKRLFPVYGLLGFVFIFILFAGVLNQKLNMKIPIRILIILITLAFVLHTIGLIIRWYISGHAPWSNGYETMIYIAWGTILSGLIFSKNSKIALATTAILASVTLMVANLSWLDPEITNLVPVLKSYWLVIHVAVITASYSFLGVGALLGFLNLILISLQNNKNYLKINSTIKELTNINEMNLIIGVFLVTIGTFLGAVWANESWGRYWGWDPKETWALVTVLVYSFIVHMRLIPGLAGLFAFNFAALIGFSSVLMTYFGVNYYLSGMHSYASGDPLPIPTFVYYTIAIVAAVSILAYINHTRFLKLTGKSIN